MGDTPQHLSLMVHVLTVSFGASPFSHVNQVSRVNDADGLTHVGLRNRVTQLGHAHSDRIDRKVLSHMRGDSSVAKH